MAQSPKPATVAIVAADQEFSRNAADGARVNAKAASLNAVYDKTYPPSTTAKPKNAAASPLITDFKW